MLMNAKKSLLLAAGLAACSTTALATDLDDRWYLSAGIGYAFGDEDRELPGTGWDVDGGPAAFVGIGKTINEWLNLELNVKANRYDLGSGNGDWKQYGATLDGLFFFSRDPKFSPYAVLGAGGMHSTKPGPNYNGAVAEAGLGVMRTINEAGDTLRAEAPAPIPVAMAEPEPTPAPPPAPVTETVVLKGVNFCFDCDTLSSEARQILDTNAMALINQRPNATFEVAGHTDAVGSDAYNQNLSERRAGSVRSYLVDQGVDASRMTAVGYGESQPVADNGTAAGRAENRRVELRITEAR
jgi:OOP family OmpA-OmpF porin